MEGGGVVVGNIYGSNGIKKIKGVLATRPTGSHPKGIHISKYLLIRTRQIGEGSDYSMN